MVLEKELDREKFISHKDRTVNVVGFVFRNENGDGENQQYRISHLYLPKLKSSEDSDEIVSAEDTDENEESSSELEEQKEEMTPEEESKVFIDQKGYIDQDGYIWIFSGIGKPFSPNTYPYFWFNKDEGKFEFSNPPEEVMKEFTVEKLKDFSNQNIIDVTLPNEVLFDEEEIADVNAGADFFVPYINEDDDYLKKIIKNSILKKKIDINRLKAKTGEKYQLPNMKAALRNKTKMSTTYFSTWAELLECGFQIIFFDNGNDKQNPLKFPLVYDSYHDTVGELINGEIIGIDNGKFIGQNDDEDEEE